MPAKSNFQITSLHVKNFKGIKEATVELAPLTIIIGGNSRGKSSLIQSLLMIAQSVSNSLAGFASLNSTSLRLGTPEEIFRRAGGKTARQMRVGVGILSGAPETPLSQELEFVFDSAIPTPRSGLLAAKEIVLKLQSRNKNHVVRALKLDDRMSEALGRQTFSISSSKKESSKAQNSKELILEDILPESENVQFWTAPAGLHGILPELTLTEYDFVSLLEKESFRIDALQNRLLVNSMRRRLSSELELIFRSLPIDTAFPTKQVENQISKIKASLEKIEFDGLTAWAKNTQALHSLEFSLRAVSNKLKSIQLKLRAADGVNGPMAQIEELKNLLAESYAVTQKLGEETSDFQSEKLDIVGAMNELNKLEENFRAECETFDALPGYYRAPESPFSNRFSDNDEVKRFLRKYEGHLGDIKKHYLATPSKASAKYLQPERERILRFGGHSAFEWTRGLTRKIHYLGPLREKDFASLDSVSISFNDSLSPVGSRAERLSEFLIEEWSKVSDFPTPKSTEPQKARFHEALEAWVCGYFELGKRLTKPQDEGRLGPIVRLDGARLHHLGTGVSQLLPVIALCLWAPPGHTVILEQPELHLHPALQQKLGTFLALMSHSGRQIIVETHSEYLVTRVRRHVSENHLDQSSCKIIFVQGDSQFIETPALLDNSNEAWPEAFFDFALDDSIAIASRTRKTSQ